MQRTTLSSCAIRAQRGINEEKCTPGMDVGMLGNGPLLGRPDLGSHVSNWLGPPHRKSRMTFFCDRRTNSANKGLLKSPWKLVTAVAPGSATITMTDSLGNTGNTAVNVVTLQTLSVVSQGDGNGTVTLMAVGKIQRGI